MRNDPPGRDRAGEVYGRWTVIRFHDKPSHRNQRWLCRCECGVERPVFINQLRSGRSASCGCLSREISGARWRGTDNPSKRVYDSDLDAVLHATYAKLGRNASDRRIQLALSFDEFLSLSTSPCVYCGSLGNLRYNVGPGKSGRRGAILNGIDRVDSSIGYEPGNCVSCCGSCNRAKHVMSTDDFRSWLVGIVAHQSAADPEFAARIREAVGHADLTQ